MADGGALPQTVLVTGACGVTSRTVVRALQASPHFAGVRYVGTDICDNAYGLYEGLYDRIYRVPRHDAAGYGELIERLCREEGIDAAIVIPEPEVLYWSERGLPVPSLLPPPRFARLAISKAAVYDALAGTGLVPRYEMAERAGVLAAAQRLLAAGDSFWMRDVSPGSTSGKGALHVRRVDEAGAWLTLHPDTPRFMLSAYLPGRNLACLFVYRHGRLVKYGAYERLDYFMGRTTVSGVSGNISVGRLLDEPAPREVADAALQRLAAATGETLDGALTVDLRETADGIPQVTEVNLRPVAAASAFAGVPGGNIAEALLLATVGRLDLAGAVTVPVPPANRILRDIDGLPLFVPEFRLPAEGEFLTSKSQRRATEDTEQT